MPASVAALVMAPVAEVSTGLTMMASTPLAMKFCTWLSCLETSSLASSICSVTPGCVLAYSAMLLRRTVRKLSSNLSIDTPILAAKAGLDSTVAAASARSMRFMVQFPPVGALGDDRFAHYPHQEKGAAASF